MLFPFRLCYLLPDYDIMSTSEPEQAQPIHGERQMTSSELCSRDNEYKRAGANEIYNTLYKRRNYIMRIIFVRHGHPNYENDCLTDLGRLHAAAAAERLVGEGIKTIYSSTCGRAYETAGYTAEKLGLPIHKCDFMREISWGSTDKDPLFLNGHPWDTVEDMIAHDEPLLADDWAQGERFRRNKIVTDVQKTATETDIWLAGLGYTREGQYYRCTGNTDTTIAAFGHGGASAAILSHMFNLPFPFTSTIMGPDYTAITIISLSNAADRLLSPRFELLNDARHIKGLQTANIYNR